MERNFAGGVASKGEREGVREDSGKTEERLETEGNARVLLLIAL